MAPKAYQVGDAAGCYFATTQSGGRHSIIDLVAEIPQASALQCGELLLFE
jgi:hypothetical protein